MTAFEELQSGASFGKETYALLLRLIRQVGRRHGFPPPVGHSSWKSEGAAEEAVQRLFDKRGPELATESFVLATDEPSLERLLLRKIEWALKDEARATPTGKLRSRLRGILESDDDFLDATALWGGTQAWTLDSNGDVIWQGDVNDLILLSTSLRLEPIAGLNPSGPTPKDVVDSFKLVVKHVLREAGGAVRDQDLAVLLSIRFDLDSVPDSLDEDGTSEPLDGAAEAADQVLSMQIAGEIFARLDAQDISLVLDLELSGAAIIAAHPDIRNPRRTISDLKARLRRMVDEFGHDPAAWAIVLSKCADSLLEKPVSSSVRVDD